jgi:hypothetical protein
MDLIIISLKINYFSPWYSWKITKLALNNNHSLTVLYSRNKSISIYFTVIPFLFKCLYQVDISILQPFFDFLLESRVCYYLFFILILYKITLKHQKLGLSIPNQIIIIKVHCFTISMVNKMNCELMLTYHIPAIRQTGSRNLTGPKMLSTIWHTYMKLVTKYQIPVINSCLEKCEEKCAYTNVC